MPAADVKFRVTVGAIAPTLTVVVKPVVFVAGPMTSTVVGRVTLGGAVPSKRLEGFAGFDEQFENLRGERRKRHGFAVSKELLAASVEGILAAELMNDRSHDLLHVVRRHDEVSCRSDQKMSFRLKVTCRWPWPFSSTIVPKAVAVGVVFGPANWT